MDDLHGVSSDAVNVGLLLHFALESKLLSLDLTLHIAAHLRKVSWYLHLTPIDLYWSAVDAILTRILRYQMRMVECQLMGNSLLLVQ